MCFIDVAVNKWWEGKKGSANEEKASAEVVQIKVSADRKQCRKNGKIPFFQKQNLLNQLEFSGERGSLKREKDTGSTENIG